MTEFRDAKGVSRAPVSLPHLNPDSSYVRVFPYSREDGVCILVNSEIKSLSFSITIHVPKSQAVHLLGSAPWPQEGMAGHCG